MGRGGLVMALPPLRSFGQHGLDYFSGAPHEKRAERVKQIFLLRLPAAFRHADVEAQQFPAKDGAVLGLKTPQELLSQPVGIFLPGRGIRAMDEAEGHERPRHRPADLAAPGHPTAERGSEFKRLALLQAEPGRKGCKHRLRTVKFRLEKRNGSFSGIGHGSIHSHSGFSGLSSPKTNRSPIDSRK